jgi:hypothetical protein
MKHSVARKTDGSLWAWGAGIAAQPTRISAADDWVVFTVGGFSNESWPGFAVALRSNGTLWTCPLDSPTPTPQRIGTDNDW